MIKSFMIFFTCLCISSLKGKSQELLQLSDSGKNVILLNHNLLRDSVNVPHLAWNNALAETAALWALHLATEDKGIFHSKNPDYGENIFMVWGSQLQAADITQDWANEREYFVYGIFPECAQPPDKVVGHYTQMIWETTNEVGCAISKSKSGKYYAVCNYNPPGNIVGDYPYTKHQAK